MKFKLADGETIFFGWVWYPLVGKFSDIYGHVYNRDVKISYYLQKGEVGIVWDVPLRRRFYEGLGNHFRGVSGVWGGG